MKRFMIAAAALTLATACRDATSPARTPSLPSQSSDRGALAPGQLWAVVNANGSAAYGSRVASSTSVGTGQYEVTFGRNVSGCAYIATTKSASSQATIAYTASGHSSVNGVYVETKNQGGGLTDAAFNLFVACGPMNTRFAVVGYTANLVRASAGTSLSQVGSGQYTITFAASVKGCAYLATVGDPADALVYNPSAVYTGSGADANTVYVETKNPGGGLQDGVPFHLALVCPTTGNARFAVVRGVGTSQRASAGTSTSRPLLGRYQVANNMFVASCAAVATRGSVNTAVPYAPATVEILPGANENSFGVQVRKLLFDGGTLTNQAFHSAVIC